MRCGIWLAAMLFTAGSAFAQSWPSKPVRIIVTFSLQFTALVDNQVKEWSKPVKDSGAKLN